MTESQAPDSRCEVDIVIIGGGIAGLWLLNHLKRHGYSVLLLESRALGSGQSIASQGIIHGGLKYAIGGSLAGAANAIAGMPARWRRCLAGDDEVDLSGCRLLSENYFMWSSGSFRSRLKTFLGSKALRGRIELVAEPDYPAWLEPARGQGALYRLEDFVVDTSSLLERLAAGNRERLFQIDSHALSFIKDPSGNIEGLRLACTTGQFTIHPQRIVLTAGAGNGSLLAAAGLTRPQMQLRPLKMLVMEGVNLPRAFVHCIGDDFSLTPRLTLTSHGSANGSAVWYLGGEVAEQGVRQSDQEQIRAASRLLADLFPWIDTRDARWSCYPIDRAEGRDARLHRPDNAFLASEGRLMVAWPTKFTLSPALADEVTAALLQQHIQPARACDLTVPARFLATPTIASPPWNATSEPS